MSTTQLEIPNKNGFAEEVLTAIIPLQDALVQLLREWGAPVNPSALNGLCKAGYRICWQVMRLANAENVVMEARHAPTPASLRRILSAAAAAGVSSQAIADVERAAVAFREFGKRNAQDRAALDSMLVGAAEGGGEKIPMSARRGAYRYMCQIWGVQTDLHYFMTMIRPSENGQGTDQVLLNAQRGVRRLRADAQVILFGYYGNPSVTPGNEQPEGAMDADAAALFHMPVLPQFSTNPLPEMHRSTEGGLTLYKIASREIGPKGSLDFTVGRYNRSAPYLKTNGRQLYHMTFAYNRKPVAAAIHELIVHRDSYPGIKPQFMMHTSHDVLSQEAAENSMQFGFDEEVEFLGPADRVGLPEVQRYQEMLRFGAGHAGWDLSEFNMYRVRIQYPIMFSATRLFFYLD